MSSSRIASFIDLARRFRRLEESTHLEEVAIKSYTSGLFGFEPSRNWESLLQETRAVILGEPGSGKTWEMRERARVLNQQGNFAFFVRLDLLAGSNLVTVLDSTEQEHFARWKVSNELAFFFLDSVDEAKFHSAADFHTSLRRLHNELGLGLIQRAKIFLSSRISEWKPSYDGLEFQRLFPAPLPPERRTGPEQSEEAPKSRSQVLVFHLEALDRLQVERFAEANNVVDVHGFLEQIERSLAWEFARRPLDVAELIEFWNREGRIGTLTELIEQDATSKLRPRDGRAEFVASDDMTSEGAKWLAAANLLSRKAVFGVPDESLRNPEALDPREFLPPQWNNDQVRALLNRAIFDGAAYGCIRFHHRRVAEYLAAKWFFDRMENGCPVQVLEDLLVEPILGRRILRPSLRAVAAWLCCGGRQWNQFVRDLVIETDPWIHLQFGDPASLDIDYRRRILTALALVSKSSRSIRIASSPASLARIADSSLSGHLTTLLSDRQLSSDFRTELLDVIRYGRLSQCIPAAITILRSADEADGLKAHAALAIGESGTLDERRQLLEIVHIMPNIDPRICANVICALYPSFASASELFGLLANVTDERDLPFKLKSHIEKVLTPDLAGALIPQVAILAKAAERNRGKRLPRSRSDRFCWMGDILAFALTKLLEKPQLAPEEVVTASTALILLHRIREHCSASDRAEDDALNELTQRHSEVRHTYLWQLVDEHRTATGKMPELADLFGYWDTVRLTSIDFEPLLVDIKTRSLSDDRLLALKVAIDLWHRLGRKRREYRKLRTAAQGDEALRVEFQRSKLTTRILPLKRLWWQISQYRTTRWWWQRIFRLYSRRWQWIRDQLRLIWNLKRIESGERIQWLSNLLREADEENHDSWTPKKWTDLENKRGNRIAVATQRGCKASWRKFTPCLPHQKSESNKTSAITIVGLTGLQVEFEQDPAAISKLSSREAKLAASYAMDELNGFPTWFERLALEHPSPVSEVLCDCIEAEWKFSPDRKEEVLSHLARLGSCPGPARDRILALLSDGNPSNTTILSLAITVLLRQGAAVRMPLCELASQRAAFGDSERATLIWLATWMQIDSIAAIARLEELLQTLPKPDEFVIGLCAILSGEKGELSSASDRPDWFRTASMRRFVPIVFRHVRVSDDNEHDGAYSPDARDDAERFRGMLLTRVESDTDPDATKTLRELADEGSMIGVRDWILECLDRRLVAQADSDPWTGSDMREFAKTYETDPRNDRDLFAIARRRLQVLKWGSICE